MTNGCRYLGGYVGEKHLEKEWIDGKVENWVESIECLSPFASLVPQSTYAGMQRALQHEWTFIQRAVPSESAAFEPLESAIQSHFLPSLIGSKVDADLRAWTSVPIKQGGMAIPMPNEMQDLNHRVSVCECSHLIRCMAGKESFDPVHHSAVVREVREEGKLQRQLKANEMLRKVKGGMGKKGARRLNYLQ